MDSDHSTGIYNRNNLSQAWRLKFNEIFDITDPQVNQIQYIYPWHWTVDGRYLYLNVYTNWDSLCSLFITGEALIRLDLITGMVVKTLPLRSSMYEYSLSSDNSHLAYLEPGLPNPILILENLVTGEEQHIPLGNQYTQAGDVIWSPDYKRIVFSAFNGDGCENTTYYLMMDLDDPDQRVLLENMTRKYFPIEWTEDNHIILYLGYDEGYGSLDLGTLEITPYLTPTPDGNP